MTFKEIVTSRRSVRVFDQEHNFDYETVKRSLELAILSPNSSNLQTWEFYCVISEEMLAKFVPACMNQSAARTASELVVFVSRRDKWKKHADWNFDNIKKANKGKEETSQFKRAKQYYTQLIPLFYKQDFLGINTLIRRAVTLYRDTTGEPMMRQQTLADLRVVVNKSTALAAQTFMLSMQNEGYATCPMEGFDKKVVKKLLNLPPKAEVTMIVACGKATADGIYAARTRVPNEEVIFEV
jgi:nitroreductase